MWRVDSGTLKWPVLWHIWTSENTDIPQLLINFHRENSALLTGHALNVFFEVKGIPGLLFGVSLLLLDPFLRNSRKERNHTVKTRENRQN